MTKKLKTESLPAAIGANAFEVKTKDANTKKEIGDAYKHALTAIGAIGKAHSKLSAAVRLARDNTRTLEQVEKHRSRTTKLITEVVVQVNTLAAMLDVGFAHQRTRIMRKAETPVAEVGAPQPPVEDAGKLAAKPVKAPKKTPKGPPKSIKRAEKQSKVKKAANARLEKLTAKVSPEAMAAFPFPKENTQQAQA